MQPRPDLILASGSPYRAALLERLGLPFRIVTSGIDETPISEETPSELATRLAAAKAAAVARKHPEAIVIGADQIAVVGDCEVPEDSEILGKPLQRQRAIKQLRRMSGQTVRFLSAIALEGAAGSCHDIVETRLRLRQLTNAEIERYVDRDQPFDCAGAMRSESLGITLLESLESDDPSALIGLPLIRISQWLRDCGFDLP